MEYLICRKWRRTNTLKADGWLTTQAGRSRSRRKSLVVHVEHVEGGLDESSSQVLIVYDYFTESGKYDGNRISVELGSIRRKDDYLVQTLDCGTVSFGYPERLF